MNSPPLPAPQTLRTLADAAGSLLVRIEGDAGAEVTGASFDSRTASSGELFFCVRGDTTDGHLFAQEVVDKGVVALCVERVVETTPAVPQILVTNARLAMPAMSQRAFGDPADGLVLAAVTGTNGKTTTAFIVDSILRADGRKTGLIGTIETRIGDNARPGVRTTPESLDLQRLLWEMRAQGVQAVTMEVTSHALAFHRVDGLHFASAAFTNLTQDHLDFHRDMEDYFATKAELFRPERVDKGAVNIDDSYGRKLYEAASVPMVPFGMSDDAEVRSVDVTTGAGGSR
ncbi:MAG: UDP-N-acetylmuramoyl-L-alanyl-D-glutamate--2,6-diaminopimelate ligase, partial [Actinomycetota bacterium]|nr:UDP-N-acetylmuramoyl-L-alanyl-D-glutamate--2,6-diaminopimelate ligase [Actinomycetota bacterium]